MLEIRKLVTLVSLSAVLMGGCSKGGDEAAKKLSTTTNNVATPLASIIDTAPHSIPSNIRSEQQCSLDAVNDILAQENTVVSKGRVIKLTGWAADLESKAVPKELFIEMRGYNRFIFFPGKKYYVIPKHEGKRPDVAEAHKAPSLVEAGWVVSFDGNRLDAGSYRIGIYQIVDRGLKYCDSMRSITIE